MSSMLLVLRQRKRTCRVQYESVEFVDAGWWTWRCHGMKQVWQMWRCWRCMNTRKVEWSWAWHNEVCRPDSGWMQIWIPLRCSVCVCLRLAFSRMHDEHTDVPAQHPIRQCGQRRLCVIILETAVQPVRQIVRVIWHFHRSLDTIITVQIKSDHIYLFQ